ncbi:LOW QUALITY PROTEIN: nuclear receptor subfamily 0 group B member 2 [Anolis carolinensis]|uniref:LOW QUALITY PROTEIN: nuclear receptor subfamily 0 group B member 2 n=1 Tax=Anolis carolinensis TaxID=28377 RepID=UPI0004629F3A|nr:PREDICTED: LOW QUALITY PROTEIN: nuclear receptor subfamily 0 group B member 2 [Anolis carolinensis]|eukprot:XP_016852061.1 PREDICTED: LOW QUALITY PROTEIN: nuclear receptor subfamily 0 group B member 2 [Anolis carolinensis]
MITDQASFQETAMTFQRPFENGSKCCSHSSSPTSIPYGVLNKEEQKRSQWAHQDFPLFPSIDCPCRENRQVILKSPNIICLRVSEVLLKTITFIRKLPSFFQLLPEDQILLIEQCWAPLFILGLAQEQVDFELEEISTPSLLKRILVNQPLTNNEQLQNELLGVSLMEAQKLKFFLGKFWDSNICVKEYAYLKGIVLFHPDKSYYIQEKHISWPNFIELNDLKYCHSFTDIQYLKCCIYIQALQLEAQQMLMEFISMIHCRNLGRYTCWLMELLGFLRSFQTNTVGELFFGDISLSNLLLETLYSK